MTSIQIYWHGRTSAGKCKWHTIQYLNREKALSTYLIFKLYQSVFNKLPQLATHWNMSVQMMCANMALQYSPTSIRYTEKTNGVISCVKSMSKNRVCHKNRVCCFLCQEHVKQRSESFLASKACQKPECVISCMKSVSFPHPCTTVTRSMLKHFWACMVTKACMYVLKLHYICSYIHYS